MPYLPEGAPLPDVNDRDAQGYWASCKRHELAIQRCTDCKAFRHPPAPICNKCRSFNFEWAKVSGKGTVYTYTTPHRAAHPSLTERVPYNVVVVEIPDADNTRIVGNLIDCPNDEVRIGMAVEVTWEDITEEVTLPQWKRG